MELKPVGTFGLRTVVRHATQKGLLGEDNPGTSNVTEVNLQNEGGRKSLYWGVTAGNDFVLVEDI